jgi:hypothetical protein
MRLLETTTRFTLLGFQFWDAARDALVSDGLRVTLRRDAPGAARLEAHTTLSGAYAFDEIPGLTEYELGHPAAALSAPARKRFIVEVDDVQGRFLRETFSAELPLPYRGLFPGPGWSSPPGTEVARCYVFSAPSRTATPPLAVIRGQLASASTGAWAAHAAIELDVAGPHTSYGIADEKGRFAVLLPYPTVTVPLGTASPPGGRIPLAAQRWSFALRVRHEPAALVYPIDSTVPHLRSIFDQRTVSVLPVATSASVAAFHGELALGVPLTLRTERVADAALRSCLLLGS